MVARGLEQSREKLAIVDNDQRYTFEEFAGRICKIGNGLRELGLLKGDRVAVLSRNSAESAELYFGVANAGFVVVMLNFRLSPAEILAILSDSRPTALIVSDEYTGHLEDIKRHCPFIQHIICKNLMNGADTDVLDYRKFVAESSSEELDTDIDEDDTAALMYTSGTTGVPKGCITSHRNLYHVGRSMALELRMSPDDAGIIPVPMFHASGAVVLLNGVYSGTTTIIMSRWNVLEFIDLVNAHQVTTGLLATPMMEALVNCSECLPEKLKSLKKVIFAGAPLSPVVFQRAVERFGNIFIHGFGTTETLGSVSILRLEQTAQALAKGRTAILGSCGKSYADMQAEVVGENGVRTVPGMVGEIRAKGLGVTQGYWQKEKETQAAFRKDWYYTGDLATVDEEGFIYIVGRKRDMIITGGENVFPAEVENVLYKHPAVAQAAVLGIADDTWGESVTAVIVKKEGMTVDEDEIRDFCRQQIAGYKIPKTVLFIDELPTSATGKLMKGKLREKIGLKALAHSLIHDQAIRRAIAP
jgi:acyl-CoA synthetase (AMP-forming)/AMP-acid ligase II